MEKFLQAKKKITDSKNNAKQIKTNNFTESNREKSIISIAILEI